MLERVDTWLIVNILFSAVKGMEEFCVLSDRSSMEPSSSKFLISSEANDLTLFSIPLG